MSHSSLPVIDQATIVWTFAILLIGAAILLKRRRSAQQSPFKCFDLSPAFGRLRPCRVDWIEPGDTEVCLQLFELNAPNRFPDGHFPEFQKALGSPQTRYLTLKLDGVTIGCGGITLHPELHLAMLCYGLIHPEHHGKGLGATSLLARLALLPPIDRPLGVGLSAVPASRGYYERYGFVQFGTHDVNGMPISEMLAVLTEELRLKCRDLLETAGVILPEVSEVTWRNEETNQPTPPDATPRQTH